MSDSALHAHRHGRAAPAPGTGIEPHLPEPKLPALVRARGLSLMRSGRTILDHVDLAVGAGEIVTLIGPNGAGKTTLVRLLLGLEKPDRGEIWRAPGLVVGYVPQRFEADPAIPLTAARFVMLGGRKDPHDVARALEEVGAGAVKDRQLSRLSGGELQRVVLARALMRDPQLLVLDEPVRGVDFAGEAELYALIGRLRSERGLGVLLVSHDLHIVMAQSDRVICLNQHVCCSGVPEAVAKHDAYVALFGAQAARAFALYSHHHDHQHDLAGAPQPVRAANAAGDDQEQHGQRRGTP